MKDKSKLSIRQALKIGRELCKHYQTKLVLKKTKTLSRNTFNVILAEYCPDNSIILYLQSIKEFYSSWSVPVDRFGDKILSIICHEVGHHICKINRKYPIYHNLLNEYYHWIDIYAFEMRTALRAEKYVDRIGATLYLQYKEKYNLHRYTFSYSNKKKRHNVSQYILKCFEDEYKEKYSVVRRRIVEHWKIKLMYQSFYCRPSTRKEIAKLKTLNQIINWFSSGKGKRWNINYHLS